MVFSLWCFRYGDNGDAGIRWGHKEAWSWRTAGILKQVSWTAEDMKERVAFDHQFREMKSTLAKMADDLGEDGR